MLREPRKLAQIDYPAMHAMAAGGAKVLHDKCVALAARFGLPILVRSSFSDSPGTWVGRPPPAYPDDVAWAAIDQHQVPSEATFP